MEMIASKIGCRLALHNREQGSLCARLVFDISEPANRVLIEVARGEVKAS
ncbi:histidine kinase [Pseudomonas poae]|nr:histidine kinase [Pseudomonas poae]KTC41615.1 histidine kinase [Pseudomonas sp. ABAC21]